QLFPNQFVNVNLHVTTLKNATIVPTAAIQHGAQGAYIYVLVRDDQTEKKSAQANKKNMTVKSIPVVVGVSLNDDTTITSGIKPGDVVVVEGADKLTDKSTVYIAGSNSERDAV